MEAFMLKTVLAPVSGLGGDEVTLECAYRAAQLFDSHIDCLYVRPDPKEILVQAGALDMGGPVITPELWSAVDEEDKARRVRTRSTFDEFCDRRKVAVSETPSASKGVTAAWQEVAGDVVHEILRHARTHEMTVIGRAPEPALSLGQTGDVLMGCGRPLVLAPGTVPKTFATTVAIAWKDTAEAARALTAAMPLLARAKRVVVLSADEGSGSAATAIESAERLVQMLRWEDIRAELRRLLPETLDIPEHS
jgi:hypothetical protein